MKITQQILPASKQVIRIGKYLYKHIDGAYSIKYSPNTCDVYFTLLYSVPEELIRELRKYQELYTLEKDTYEMHFNINITTYQNKVRININEISPEERTIGQTIYSPEVLMDLDSAYKKIMDKLKKQLNKRFQGYDFVF